MRDAARLRRRLAWLACVPTLLVACDDPTAPEPAQADREVAPAGPSGDVQPAPPPRRTRPEARDDETEDDAPPESLDPEVARLMPIEGDPPFIDGYNPEEATCVSGNWCGTLEAATAIAPNADRIESDLGCPLRIAGTRHELIQGPAYAGLSNESSMQGALNQHGTELARAEQKSDEICCYHWFEYCSGRPLLDDAPAPRVAPVVPGRGGWADADPELAPLARSPQAQALARAWLDDALAEHASVASFARSVLELMAVGAPPELLTLTQQAMLDEIEHTRLCLRLHRAYAGTEATPGPLPPPATRPSSVVRLAVDTFLEGCVGETVAALGAERAAASAAHPVVARTLARIADDEARHAALAWRTVAWALAQAPTAVGAALREAAARCRPGAPTVAAADPELRAHGRLDGAARQATLHDAWNDIVVPMLDDLLAA